MAYDGSGALPGTITYVEPGDSAATIQSKMNSVQPGNSLVFVGGATYDFDNTTIVGKSGVTVWADGAVTIENAPGAGSHGAFDFSGQSNWTIGGTAPGAGFIFDGSLIDATNASGNWSVGNCEFNGQAANGYDGSAISMNGASFGTIINNDFNNVGGTVVGMYNLTNITIDGNHFTNCFEPISLQEPTTADTSLGQNIVIERNVFTGTQRVAIEAGPASSGAEFFSGLVIHDNYFDNFNNSGEPGTLLAISAVGLASENTTITDNYISRGPTDAGQIGVAIEVAGSGTVSGNTIANFSFATLTYQSGWNLHDNDVSNDGSSPYFGFSSNDSGVGTFGTETEHTGTPTGSAGPVRLAWGGPVSLQLPQSSSGEATSSGDSISVPAHDTSPAPPDAPADTGSSTTEQGATAVVEATFANGQVVLTGTSEAGSNVSMFEGLHLIGSATADNSGHWTIAGSAEAGVFHSYGAVSVDSSGNVQESTHDYQPPIGASNNPASEASAEGDLAPAATDATSSVLHDFTADAGNSAAVDQADPATHSIAFNSNVSAPAINAATFADDQIGLQGAGDAGSVVSVYDGKALLGSVSTDTDGGFRFLASLDGDSVHSYSATSTDTAGNVTNVSGHVYAGSTVADTIKGSAGADLVVGGGGADNLSGGKGADTFAYFAPSDSTSTAPDKITDFHHGTDKIDFTNIAGIASSNGIPAFQGQLMGTGNVGLAAHSVAFLESGANTLVLVNTTGSTETVSATDTHSADMQIDLVGVHLGLTATDFHHS